MLRIGECAAIVGLSIATLRSWDAMGIISPIRSSGGERLYSQNDVAIIERIIRIKAEQGLSPRAISHLLKSSQPANSLPSNQDDDFAAIARGIRRERKRAGLTLKQVSESTGVSISHLSAVERNQQRPSFAVLLSLTQFFGIMIQDLIANRDEREYLVKGTKRPRLPTMGEGIQIEQLTKGDTNLESQLFIIPPFAESGGFYRHRGEEFVYVLSGQLVVSLEGEGTFHLESEDALTFRSQIAHQWKNPSGNSARVLWVTVQSEGP